MGLNKYAIKQAIYFKYFTRNVRWMTDKERIDSLQAEAERLSQQLHRYDKELAALRQEILHLKNGNTNPTIGRASANESTSGWSLENFIGLRLIHLFGIVILVIGLSIGVKYAIDKNLISEGMRIILAYLAGITLYGLSFWLRKKYGSFSAILFSGAMASLYFTTGRHFAVHYDRP